METTIRRFKWPVEYDISRGHGQYYYSGCVVIAPIFCSLVPTDFTNTDVSVTSHVGKTTVPEFCLNKVENHSWPAWLLLKWISFSKVIVPAPTNRGFVYFGFFEYQKNVVEYVVEYEGKMTNKDTISKLKYGDHNQKI